MTQKFERTEKHLYRRQYQTAGGEWTALFYARFVCRLKKKRRVIPLGSDLSEARDKLKRLEVRDMDRYDFDLDRQRVTTNRDGKSAPFTFTEWAERYERLDDVKRGRSLPTKQTLISLHLKPFFGTMLLTEITREALRRYVDARTTATVIRCGKASKKAVHRGTVSNELSLLRHMLRLAAREEFKVIVPSFLGLIARTKRGGRALSVDEQEKVNAVYPTWMRRLAEFATETCLSEGDLIRLSEDMIDEQAGVIIPEGGRKKTEAEQISPLTKRAHAILKEIRAERRRAAAIPNVKGLIFTNPDGTPITKGQIAYQVECALKLTGVKKFVFHNYRNTALSEWKRQGRDVDAAMMAGGWKSVAMYKRYLDMKPEDVAKAFGTSPEPEKIATRIVTEKAGGYAK